MELVDPPHVSQLKQSLIERGAAKPAGTTWGDLFEAIRALGFKDSDPRGSIEVGVSAWGRNHIIRQDDDILEI